MVWNEGISRSMSNDCLKLVTKGFHVEMMAKKERIWGKAATTKTTKDKFGYFSFHMEVIVFLLFEVDNVYRIHITTEDCWVLNLTGRHASQHIWRPTFGVWDAVVQHGSGLCVTIVWLSIHSMRKSGMISSFCFVEKVKQCNTKNQELFLFTYWTLSKC